MTAYLLGLAVTVGVTCTVVIVLGLLRPRDEEAPDATQEWDALAEAVADALADFQDEPRGAPVELLPAAPLSPTAARRWEAIRDYLIDDPDMRSLVEPFYRGPSET